MTGRRFAEDTSVPVVQTQGEVKKRLWAAGASHVAIMEGQDLAQVGFRIADVSYRVTVPLAAKAKNRAQDERRAWRLAGLLIKAKLEAVREGATTVEREFMADMVMPSGETMTEAFLPMLTDARRRGIMPGIAGLLGAPR